MPAPPADAPATAPSRLLQDRRGGVDRRVEARRRVVGGAGGERRRLVDRRRGPERRSTLERRGRPGRGRGVEAPAEHLRNALQLLEHVIGAAPGSDSAADLAAALGRVRLALAQLERR